MQIRKRVNGFWAMPTQGYELVVGSNTGNKEIEEYMFAIGEIISKNETRYIHLKISDVKKIIAEHEEAHKKKESD